ncbi:MAG: hypothetical protein GF333_05855 [Candidatus Omnitrophica bacterium]|nr:hypothetical protein [Candidatus Omnitrophota bacterium]
MNKWQAIGFFSPAVIFFLTGIIFFALGSVAADPVLRQIGSFWMPLGLLYLLLMLFLYSRKKKGSG